VILATNEKWNWSGPSSSGKGVDGRGIIFGSESKERWYRHRTRGNWKLEKGQSWPRQVGILKSRVHIKVPLEKVKGEKKGKPVSHTWGGGSEKS